MKVYPILRLILFPFFKLLIKKVDGIENLPSNCNFIVISNHQKLIDPVPISYIIAWKCNKKIHFISSTKWWSFLGDSICRDWAGCIPVDNKKESYKIAKNYLIHGKIVGIFPEGYINSSDRSPKTGAIRLAAATNLPILPFSIVYGSSIFDTMIKIGVPIYITNQKNARNKINKIMIRLQK